MTLVPLETALAPRDLTLLRTLGDAASRSGVRLWLVGGAVRDAFLERPTVDLDITAQAPAGELAQLLAAAANGHTGSHSQFGTVKLTVRGRTLDLATARSERYARPGALPSVAPSHLLDDLARRDIAINAMAASLAPEDFGELLDTEGGLADLRAGRIRVLHERSFQDDATRIMRVVRYATRLGFRVERRTAYWLRRDLGNLATISPSRVRRELERTLNEERSVRALATGWRMGMLEALHPELGEPGVAAALRRAAMRRAPPDPLVLLGVLVYALGGEHATASAPGIDGIARRLGLTRRQRSVAEHTVRIRDIEPLLDGSPPSDVHALIGPAPREAIAACAIASPSLSTRGNLSRYLKRLRDTRVPLNGSDLLAMGVPEGPELGLIVSALRGAVLDGAVLSRRGAISFVRSKAHPIAWDAPSPTSVASSPTRE
jgi:tRNA nucleotidyltransferase (CCA-adding enzyme)